MNKTVIAVFGIVAVASLIAFYIWVSLNRYYVTTGSAGVAYEVDRKTGESWMLHGDKKIRQKGGGESRQKGEELPYAEARKVNARGEVSHGAFFGELYNGSDWAVTRLILNLSLKEQDGSVRWSRDYSKAVTITPLTWGEFTIVIGGEDEMKNTDWTINNIKMFGYKE